VIRIFDGIGADTAIEEAANHGLGQRARRADRPVHGDIMRTEPSASLAQSGKIRGWREGRQRDRRLLIADVPDPVALLPVLAIGRGGFLGLDHQIARRQRQREIGIVAIHKPQIVHAA
jgi:predicted MPP superfamily phosphohydrolase